MTKAAAMTALDLYASPETLPASDAARIGKLLGLNDNETMDDVALAERVSQGLKPAAAAALGEGRFGAGQDGHGDEGGGTGETGAAGGHGRSPGMDVEARMKKPGVGSTWPNTSQAGGARTAIAGIDAA